MRFMTLVKSSEKSGPPPKELMDAIAKLGEVGMKSGFLIETSGLMPSALGARVRLSGGKLTVTDGPFAEAKEAIEQTVRFMELHKKHWPGWEGKTEIRQVFDTTDFHPGAANP